MANRARTRAIRERMARTGESYTAAARNHDNERRNPEVCPICQDTGNVGLGGGRLVVPCRCEAPSLRIEDLR